jgi:hypothetical protein
MRNRKKRTRVVITMLSMAFLGVLAFVGCSLPGSGGGTFKGGGADGKSNGPALVNLRSAAGINGGAFAILAKSTVTTTGATSITGDVGLSPAATSYLVGFGTLLYTSVFQTSTYVTGKLYAANMHTPTPSQMSTAISDMYTAYVDAAGRAIPTATELYAGDLSGKTIAPGLYKWSTGVLINTPNLTLAGGANDTWIFQISKDLTVGSGAQVILSGGAQAKNVFWQVGGGTGVTLSTTSHMEGIILAAKSIVLKSTASVNGRLFAQFAVTLIANAITVP